MGAICLVAAPRKERDEQKMRLERRPGGIAALFVGCLQDQKGSLEGGRGGWGVLSGGVVSMESMSAL